MPNCKVTIYKYTNLFTGKCYVGSSNRVNQRKREHIKEAINPKNYFHRSIAKWGIEAFQFDIIEECCCLIRIQREQFHIDRLGSFDSGGYNSASADFVFQSEEAKRRAAQAAVGRKWSAESRAKLSKALTGIKRSPETLKKMSEANLGKKHGPYKPRIGPNPLIGRKATPEARKNMSDAHKGKPLSAANIKHISEALKGKPSRLKGTTRSPEFKKKVADGMRRHWENKVDK